jgi:hypothetical protein
VVYVVGDRELIVMVVRVAHRRDVYRRLQSRAPCRLVADSRPHRALPAPQPRRGDGRLP